MKVQRCYADKFRSGIAAPTNSDKEEIFESLGTCLYVYSAMAVFAMASTALDSTYKGLIVGQNSATGQSSIYGTHFHDIFLGAAYGRYILHMNEPTDETDAYVTVVTGTARWNSAGGVILRTIGDQVIWEDRYFRVGHTGFVNVAPVMSGGTITYYTVEYQIDTGTGWNGTWKTLNGTNLSGETVDPSIGFKLKIRITTISASATAAITYLRVTTTTTAAAQSANLYSLAEEVPLKITVLDAATFAPVSGATVYLLTDVGGPAVAGVQIFKTVTDALGVLEGTYLYSGDQPVTGRARKGPPSPYYKTAPISATIGADGLDLVVFQVPEV